MKKTILTSFLFFFVANAFGFEMRQPLQVDYLNSMKKVDSATTGFRKLPGGKLELNIEHEIIAGVTPDMLVWWMQNFPERTIEVNNKEVPWYWLWHPVDHIKVIVKKEGDNGERGIATGAKVEIHEYFGDTYHKFTPRIEKLNTEGLHLTMCRGGIKIGDLKHRFYKTEQGTRYVSTLVVGADAPVAKYIFNYLVRPLVFSDEVAKAWFRHNVEEVGNFQFFLPALYAEHHKADSITAE